MLQYLKVQFFEKVHYIFVHYCTVPVHFHFNCEGLNKGYIFYAFPIICYKEKIINSIKKIIPFIENEVILQMYSIRL